MKPATRSFYADAIQRTIERIVTDLDAAIDHRALAASVNLSPFHFHRVFKGMVSETPLELARRLRMERAAWRLVNSPSGITDIAFGAGFDTHEAFTRAFRAAYGAPPSEYRTRPNPRRELAASSGIHYEPHGAVALFTPQHFTGNIMHVDINPMPAMRVACLRHVGPYNQISATFTKLGELAGRAGLMELRGAMMVALYHDDPEATPAADLKSDAGVVIPADLKLPAGFSEQRIPAGNYACTTHIGPYEGLGDTWMRLMGEWLPTSGRRIGAGPSFEIYRNDPRSVPPKALETEICVPVE